MLVRGLAPLLLPVLASSLVWAAPGREPLFSRTDSRAIVEYWSQPGRLSVRPPADASTSGPWQVRLTPAGSTWLLAYQKAVAGPGKTAPTQDARATGNKADWEMWVAAQVAYDRAVATRAAITANAAVVPASADLGPLPTPPGPMPATLLAACGNPPVFANIVAPLQHSVTFADEPDVYVYLDNVKLRERYAYYRFPQGTVAYGPMLKDLPPDELEELFDSAGYNSTEKRVLRAVSPLEGGFETVQTYDTGFVSIGFIQFVTLADGKADLTEVLLREKTDRPSEFNADFHRFGIDVSPEGDYVVVDPSTGVELTGADAVMKTVNDKRLTAVFQRAGRKSKAFRVAQIQIAKAHYWPVNDPVNVTIGGSVVVGTVGDVVKSEAGIATLFDRKVNVGNIRIFADVLQRVINTHKIKSLADASAYEREIVMALKYRADFLNDTSLSQPPPLASATKVSQKVR